MDSPVGLRSKRYHHGLGRERLATTMQARVAAAPYHRLPGHPRYQQSSDQPAADYPPYLEKKQVEVKRAAVQQAAAADAGGGLVAGDGADTVVFVSTGNSPRTRSPTPKTTSSSNDNDSNSIHTDIASSKPVARSRSPLFAHEQDDSDDDDESPAVLLTLPASITGRLDGPSDYSCQLATDSDDDDECGCGLAAAAEGVPPSHTSRVPASPAARKRALARPFPLRPVRPVHMMDLVPEDAQLVIKEEEEAAEVYEEEDQQLQEEDAEEEEEEFRVQLAAMGWPTLEGAAGRTTSFDVARTPTRSTPEPRRPAQQREEAPMAAPRRPDTCTQGADKSPAGSCGKASIPAPAPKKGGKLVDSIKRKMEKLRRSARRFVRDVLSEVAPSGGMAGCFGGKAAVKC
jgi:hypothetical protein